MSVKQFPEKYNININLVFTTIITEKLKTILPEELAKNYNNLAFSKSFLHLDSIYIEYILKSLVLVY